MLIIGPLQISAPATWLFHEFNNLTLGVRDSDAGVLQISSAFRTDVPTGAQPDLCEEIALEWIGEPAMEFNREVAGDDAFGSAPIVCDGAMGRVWYALRDGQLIIASYRPKPGQDQASLVDVEIEEAVEIVRSCRWIPAAGG